jgi:cell division protein FtsL
MTTTKHTEKHSKQGFGASDALPPKVFSWLRLFSYGTVLVTTLMVAVVLSALAVVYTSYNHRMTFHELQQLRVQSNEFDIHWGQLLIEQSTFGLEGRIERRAIDELNMTLPDWSKIIMVRYE